MAQRNRCFEGSKAVYKDSNVDNNAKVSAKRGTGVCARGMCPDDVVEGKNLCALHQKELDDRNQDKMAEHQKIKARAAEVDDEGERKKIMLESSVYANNQLALALDKKNRPLVEALNSEFAAVHIDDDDYADKLDEYLSKLAGFLKGTKNLVTYAKIDGLIKSTASNLSYRSGRILSPIAAKDFILRVIHKGPIAGTDAVTSLTAEERQTLSGLLETAEFCCYWTNAKLVFSSFAGFNQFSPDRIGLQSLSYFDDGQQSAAVCLWAQRLMNNMNPDKRERFIRLLIAKYNPTRADIFIANYVNGVDNGVVFGDDARKYWENKWESQSKEAREAFANTPSKRKKDGTWKVLEDIRDWGKDEKVEDSQLKGDIDWVTGIDRADLMEFGGLADDRKSRQHSYSAPDTYPTSTRLNDAREADPAFHTRSSLAALAAKHEISELQVIIKMQRQMVEALIGHWRG
ncbi:hypothetical protein BJ741DRAFT_586294 [Chytriomyces cf. hyalinus JEL632]|nr:hypothetical protein BJ741DRAFT_586294 [Chytriomyces cf. hyalinus JEL632]